MIVYKPRLHCRCLHTVSAACASTLRKCASLADGKLLHLELSQSGRDQETFLGNLLVGMYGRCGSLDDARLVFENISHRNPFSWNILMIAYAKNRHMHEAEDVFERMPVRNIIAWNYMIAAYGEHGEMEKAKEVFQRAPEKDVISWTSMLVVNAQKGHLQESENLFNKLPERSIVSWNGMVKAYTQNGHPKEALTLLQCLLLNGVHPDKVTVLCSLDASTALTSSRYGKAIHAICRESSLQEDTEVGTALVNMYGRFGMLQDALRSFNKIMYKDTVSWTSVLVALAQNGHLQEARRMFSSIREPDFITWNAMITAYAQAGHPKEAMEFFKLMDLEGMRADKVTFVVVLDICASINDLRTGMQVHEEICNRDLFGSNVIIGTALVDMYAKCGSLQNAREVFNHMPKKNVISWNAIMSAYTKNGYHFEAKIVFDKMSERDLSSWNCMIQTCVGGKQLKEAVKLFMHMDMDGINHDVISMVSALDACASLPDVSLGRAIHASIEHLDSNVMLATAVLDMYGKCGCFIEAKRAFERGVRGANSSAALWNALMSSYSQRGEYSECIALLWRMAVEGVQPSGITFVSCLAACSHVGLECNIDMFCSMVRDFQVRPTQEHYACVIDQLGREGRVLEAEELVDNMPFEADRVSWTAFLSACGIHGDIARGERAWYTLDSHDNMIQARIQENPNQLTPFREEGMMQIQALTNSKDLSNGRRLHACLLENGHCSSRLIANLLINMYGKCGNVEEAKLVFNQIHKPNIFSWNILIDAYAQNGHTQEARDVFDNMPVRDTVSCATILKMYTQEGHMNQARNIFEGMPEWNLVSCNIMVTAYAQNKELLLAKELFENMPEKDEISWTAILNAYHESGYFEQALNTFWKMPMQDAVSWTVMITAYAGKGHIEDAREMFDSMPKQDEVAWTVIVQAYVSHEQLEEARQLFLSMPRRRIINWNTMVQVHAQKSRFEKARELFNRMPQWDVFSWTIMVTASAENGNTQEAAELFHAMPQRNLVSWNAIIQGYVQNQEFARAHETLERMSLHDPVSWTSVMTSYARTGQMDKAKEVFYCMPHKDTAAWNAALEACVYNGRVEEAWKMFLSMSGVDRDDVSWSTMVTCFARNGLYARAMELFLEMQLEGLKADDVVFIGILTGCSHAGLVDECCTWFVSMVYDYDVELSVDHYGCLVDALGRAGKHEEAQELISYMPVYPDEVACTAVMNLQTY